jgi:hypothetical protein
MRTILYNVDDDRLLSEHEGGYLVNGRPGLLHANIVQLELVRPEYPALDLDTQRIVETRAVDLEAGECVVSYAVEELFVAEELES